MLCFTEHKPLFDKILIANRGEIACRVMRTAKKLGIRTVAVFSEADKDAQHVKLADEAYLIGPAASSQSYLDGSKILAVAKASGAQAIHPGYGFLSENADFADATLKEGIVFIGPPGQAMRSMGSKSESKNIMQAANVPVVPGYHGTNQDPAFLKSEAAKIGYPVLIKAIKGGGGKGMRIVNNPEEFDQMLESSKRESMKSFGDDHVLIEKYLVRPRHVEVQVFADTHGNAVHLFERDCSVQRRHQKVIEEAPAPGLSEAIRNELGTKAVAAAKAVGYVNAGTVEFIMDNVDKKFYFMEMNTRLQVEHPVTEMVTGTDLVQWQLEVAAGNILPKKQDELTLDGHAFEARVYAENPYTGFLPDTGVLSHITPPAVSSSVRLETGFEQGDAVSVHYDPMIAKLVVKGRDRDEALRVLRRSLAEYQIAGLNTNISFLQTLASHPEFIKGEVETGFIKQYEQDLLTIHDKKDDLIRALVSATNGLLLEERNAEAKFEEGIAKLDAFSPWASLTNAFRPNYVNTRRVQLCSSDGKQTFNIDISYPKNPSPVAPANQLSYGVVIADAQTNEQLANFDNITTTLDPTDHVLTQLDSKRLIANVVLPSSVHSEYITVFSDEHRVRFKIPQPEFLHGGLTEATGSVMTPMPCKISQVLVKPGQKVEQGAPLVVLEAMKMEHLIKSPFDGVIGEVIYRVGDMVGENKPLVKFEEAES